MTRRKPLREPPVFGMSAVDIFCNTVGALTILLFLFALFSINSGSGNPAERIETDVTPLHLLTRGELPSAEKKREYSYYLSARGGSGKYRWSSANLPPGLQLDPSSGRMFGTPSISGNYEFLISVSDKGVRSGAESFLTAGVSLKVKSITKQSARHTPNSAAQEDGSYSWLLFLLGILALVLIQQMMLFYYRKYMSTKTQRVLKQYSVDLINRHDGTAELNGPSEMTKKVADKLTPMYKSYKFFKMMSLLGCGVLLAIYLIYFLL